MDLSPSGTHRGVLATTTSISPQSQTFDYSATNHPDALTEWSFDGVNHELTLHASGRRDEHTTFPGGVTYPYSYGHADGIELITLRNVSGSNPLDINVDYDTNNGLSLPALGTMRRIDYGDNGVYEVEHIGYAARGDIKTTDTNSTSGVITHQRDELMRRWKKINGLVVTTNYRWFGSQLIDFYTQQPLSLGGGFNRDEYIYLGGAPIGAVHTDSTNTTPALSFLSPDGRGIPRRVLSTTSLAQSRRLVLDAWGKGSMLVDVSGPGPDLPFRFAGQIADVETGLSENNWRMYLPDLGVYLSPDPMHKMSATMLAGPQAFAYASGRPLVFADPLGLVPGDDFQTPDEAAADALQYAAGLTATSSYAVTYGAQNQYSSTMLREYGGCVCRSCDEGFYATRFVEARDGVSATPSILMQFECGADRVVATFHSHVSTSGPSAPDDFDRIRENGLAAGFVVSTDGTLWKYNGSGVTSITPYAVDVPFFAGLFSSGSLQRGQFISIPGGP